MATATLYLDNDHLLQLDGLFNVTDSGGVTHPTSGRLGDWVNDADVDATLFEDESEATPVTGQTWPLTLAYVAGSDGVYEGVVENTVDVVAGTSYWAVVTVSGGTPNRDAKFRLKVKAKVRKET